MSFRSANPNDFFAIGHKLAASDAEFSASVGTARTAQRVVCVSDRVVRAASGSPARRGTLTSGVAYLSMSTLSPSPLPPRGITYGMRHIALTTAGFAGLTLLFGAQHAALQAAIGLPVDWGGVLLAQSIHWGVWMLLFPVLLFCVGRYRLDLDHRPRRVLLWILIGAGLSIAQAGIVSAVPAPESTTSIGSTIGALIGRRVIQIHAPGVNEATLGRRAWRHRAIGTLAPNLLVFALLVGVLHAVLYYRDLRTRRIRETELEARLARAELKVLRAQLQPHFLFNTLHTVSSLMVDDVPGARRVLASLGELLRLSIDSTSRQEISLRDELEFVARYVDIQRARFGDRLDVHVDVAEESYDALVPNLILQPLVENAIRHGIEPHSRTGNVWISARCAADGATLTLTVRDDGLTAPDSPPAANGATSPRTGTGLANMSARLTQLYGTRHAFRAGRGESGFEVVLSFPFRTGDERSATLERPS